MPVAIRKILALPEWDSYSSTSAVAVSAADHMGLLDGYAVMDAAVVDAAVTDDAVMDAAVMGAAVKYAAVMDAVVMDTAVMDAAVVGAAVLNGASRRAAAAVGSRSTKQKANKKKKRRAGKVGNRGGKAARKVSSGSAAARVYGQSAGKASWAKKPSKLPGRWRR